MDSCDLGRWFSWGPDADGVEVWESPRFHGTISGCGDDEVCGIVDQKFGDGAFVCEARLEDGVDGRGGARLEIPDPDAAIVACAEDELSVCGEPDSELFALRLVEGIQTFSVVDAPQFDRLIGTGGGEHLAVRREGDMEDRAVVSFKRVDGSGVLRMEEGNSPVVPADGYPFSVGRESCGVEDVFVFSFECLQDGSVGGIDEKGFSGATGDAGGGEEEGSIGSEFEVIDLSWGCDTDPGRVEFDGFVACDRSETSVG